MKKNILIIGAVWVEPHSSAAGSRMLQLINYFLKEKYHVTFATTTQKTSNAIDLTNLGVAEIIIELNATSFDTFITNLNPNIVVFDRFMIEEQFGWRVADHCPNALRILDTEDLHSLRKTRHESIKKATSFSINELLISDIAKREIAAILRCDLSLIISSFEMKLLEETFKIDASLLLHLPFMLKTITTKERNEWLAFEERQDFVTIGNFLHAPNVDAVIQLKKDIWPKIRKEIPKARLHIYGAYPTQQILQMHNENEGFLVKGFAVDANEIIGKAKVVLAPIRFGAGIKGKLTEAMLNGTPSVTTTIGAEGMHDNLAWNGFIENETENFVSKAIELYTDKMVWNNAQKNGVEIINQMYNKEQLERKLFLKLEELKHNFKEHRIQNFLGALLQHQTLRSTKYMSKWIEEKNKNNL